jgi:multiple sugar transport system permease protein
MAPSAHTAPPPRRAGPARKALAWMQSPLLTVFMAASMLYLLVFIGLPIVYTLVMSVQDVTLANIVDLIRPYVGLDNYRAALDDPSFRKVLVNSVIFVGVNVIGQVGIGLAAALFFAQRFPGAHFMRGLLLSSWILPALVVGALWRWIFATEYGVANYLLAGLGLIGSPIHWLSDPAVALSSVTTANIWFGTPFSMILIAAGLTGIPLEQYEAAALDGAGPVARFRHITLPALWPTLLAVSCLVTIYTMRAFDLIFAMTQGGPLDASNVLPLLSYQFSFQRFHFGIGAAVGSTTFVIVIAVALVYVRTLRGEARE